MIVIAIDDSRWTKKKNIIVTQQRTRKFSLEQSDEEHELRQTHKIDNEIVIQHKPNKFSSFAIVANVNNTNSSFNNVNNQLKEDFSEEEYLED